MTGLIQIVLLELRALLRTGLLPLLWLFAFLWTFCAPFWLQTDGTEAGARELCLMYGVGTVFVVALVAFGGAAAGSLAKEREAKRLQLSLVRPTALFLFAWGRMAAYTLACASVIVVSLVLAAFQGDPSRPTYEVRQPLLPTPAEEAEVAYADYMSRAETPEKVKKMKKADVLRILEQKSYERYETIPPQAVSSWRFSLGRSDSACARRIRLKFTTPYETRAEVQGVLSCGAASVAVTNVAKAVLLVPLPAGCVTNGAASVTVSFRNTGRSTLMLRPRRDVQLLEEKGTFARNLVRAGVVLVSLAALILAPAVFLGAGLGRSVAVFTLFGFLFVSAAGPDIIENYPDPLESKRMDRLGLELTRSIWRISRPFARPLPVRALVADECVAQGELLATVVVSLGIVPAVFAVLSAYVLRRKEEGL